MKQMEKISFIIPFYDVEKDELLNCVNSIVDEKFSNYEIIIVNDGYNNDEIIFGVNSGNQALDNVLKKLSDILKKGENK